MRRTRKPAKALAVLILCICAVPAYAVLIPPDIAGTSTATPITGGPYDGWFLYEINIEWNFEGMGAGSGLSHWDLVLIADCPEPDVPIEIEFDTPAGYSTTATDPDPMAMGWTGYFLTEGDPSAGIAGPVVKYNNPFFPIDAQPGEQGNGTFSFYANVIPEYDGFYENALVAKTGLPDPIFGDLQGDYPSCTIIPEPSALLLLACGGLALLRRRRV